MSVSTLSRLLYRVKAEEKKGLSTTKPAETMKNKVPINTLDYEVTQPGITQADTVAHCGTSAAGEFVSSLTLIDIASLWTENDATYAKKGHEVRKAFTDIQRRLPFKLKAVNTDSGSEFLNITVLEWMNKLRPQPITFTRSRPYKKNNHCYVE